MTSLLIALAAVMAVCVGVYALGMYAQRRIKRLAPERLGVRRMSWLEIMHASLAALCLFAGIAAYELAPESALGSFLHEPYGILSATIAATLVLYVLGIPVAYLKLRETKRHGV